MKFARLRLLGFKSFVEPTELAIEPGLTGIVGPNGCGKSNLLEGLRWVMGESSHKNMRASAMDDVIFAGTTARPPRNVAEVTLTLDNREKLAPPGFNDAETIEVTRRVERQSGSDYRVNGREVRARDVQLLFADASTGARSPALVRQGQVSELINAKPAARRRILEEAAGITGLYTRRHEAELRLDAAEANLNRLDDVIGQLETQLASLKRQARQAQRYKLLSADIRRLEAAALYRNWAEARDGAAEQEKIFHEAMAVLAEATQAAEAAERARQVAEAELPALRDAMTVRAAVVQRLRHEHESLEAEEQRSAERYRDIKDQLSQVLLDLRREQDIISDSDSVSERLAAEETALQAAASEDETRQNETRVLLTEAAARLERMQVAADSASARFSECLARQSSLATRIAELEARAARIEREVRDAQSERDRLQADDGDASRLRDLAADLRQGLAEIEVAERSAQALEEAIAAGRQEHRDSRSAYDVARRKADALSVEVRTLAKVLTVSNGQLWPPMLDAVDVEPGYERALAAAFGEELDAAEDVAAPAHWFALPGPHEPDGLPGGAVPLSAHVKAPAAMARSLAAIGLVENDAGRRLQSQLRPGQRLVSREGDLWRWDGYTRLANAASPAAIRLAERNRLEGLRKDAEQAERIAAQRKAEVDAMQDRLDDLVAQERRAREALKQKQRTVGGKRAEVAVLERRMVERDAKLNALDQTINRLSSELADVSQAKSQACTELDTLEKPDALKMELDQLRMVLSEERAQYADARARHDVIAREAQARVDRLTAITKEQAAWQARTAKAAAQVEVLEERAGKARATLTELAAVPAEMEARRGKLMTMLAEAEEQDRTARTQFEEAQASLHDAESKERHAAQAMAAAREEHVRIQAILDAMRLRLKESAARIEEVLNTTPVGALRLAGAASLGELPSPREISSNLARLKADRERLGGVNLRAEDEAQAVATQLDTLTKERDDVIEAVRKLRQAIQNLNREGRQRLLDAFNIVNSNFRDLFGTLFGGGEAELKLIESDDPLEAGLEIIANPPGKRPQVLSLLSGGEQALTAVALIFAVFLTNPSPICVMDEVDAPLDDANVERFCNLLDAMLTRADTRFLVITHHPVTMARMHRLYGVTMMERGVSQLVSVDLEAAEAMREAS